METKFGFSLSQVYREYQKLGETSNLRQRRLGRRATLSQIAVDFNAELSKRYHRYGAQGARHNALHRHWTVDD